MTPPENKSSREEAEVIALRNKRQEQIESNPLLEALTLVIESNAEYARGVTTILDSDLERELLLNEIKKEVLAIRKTVDKNNEDITRFNTQILVVLDKLRVFDKELAEALNEKLKPLYVAADLQESGAQYNPTDKLVIALKNVLTSKVSLMIIGVIIWVLLKLLMKSSGLWVL